MPEGKKILGKNLLVNSRFVAHHRQFHTVNRELEPKIHTATFAMFANIAKLAKMIGW